MAAVPAADLYEQKKHPPVLHYRSRIYNLKVYNAVYNAAYADALLDVQPQGIYGENKDT